MANFPLLEIGISLVLIYFLFSSLVSGLTELLMMVTAKRGKMLKDALSNMFSNGSNNKFALDLFKHPLISKLKKNPDRFPSYIKASTVSSCLIDVAVNQYKSEIETSKAADSAFRLNPSTKKTFEDFESAVGTMEDGDLKKLLKSFLINAKDIKELKANIDGWYNEYMDRVTGWFKRSSRWMVAATAIVVVLAFNIDSIKLVKELWQNNALRTSLVVQAGDLVNENESGNETHGMETINVETDSGMSVNKGMMDSLKVALKGIQNQLQKIDSLRAKTKSLQLPIGWKSRKDYENKKSNISFFELVKFNIQDIYLLEVLGWLITAIALTFGAPFWFDLLARFVNTRNAGKKPEN